MSRLPGRLRATAGDRRGLAAPVLLLLAPLALALAIAVPAQARLPWLDPLPAWSPADTLANRAFALEATRLGDGRTGWAADRVVLEARFAGGGSGFFYARLPWVRFDTAALPALARWPELAGDGAQAGWPGEAVVSGFGQLELGAAGPVRLPLLGTLAAGIGAGAPLGHSRAYPLSSAGLPLRLELTRRLRVSGAWNALAGAGLLRHGGAGDEVLDEAAFPDGNLARLGLERASGTTATRLEWTRVTRGGRGEQWLAAELVVPWDRGGRLGARFAREVSGSADRAAAWTIGLSWRLLPRPSAPAAARAPGAPKAAGAPGR